MDLEISNRRQLNNIHLHTPLVITDTGRISNYEGMLFGSNVEYSRFTQLREAIEEIMNREGFEELRSLVDQSINGRYFHMLHDETFGIFKRLYDELIKVGFSYDDIVK